jgi:hypothetical protein
MDYYDNDIMYSKHYLEHFCVRFKAPLVDRTGVMNRQIAVMTPIPTKPDMRDVLFDVVSDDRANEILQRAKDENKDIRISYSGGIDSTAALVGLLKFKDEYPEVNITAVLSQESIDEYPAFYENYIKDKLDVIKSGQRDLNTKLTEQVAEGEKDFLVVTGELGDQLFGSALMFKEPYDKRLAWHWEKAFTPMFVQFWKPLVEYMPQSDFSAANVFWWLNFVLKYQWVEMRIYAMVNGQIPFDNIVHFFGGDRFQRWSMMTPMDVKFTDLSDPTTYKMPAKEYIYDYTGDREYLENKLKIGSLKTNLERPIRRGLERITTSMEIIRDDESNQIYAAAS